MNGRHWIAALAFASVLVCDFSTDSNAAVIASWNFNHYDLTSTTLSADSGSGTLFFPGFSGDTNSFTGTTLNALAEVAAGRDLALQNWSNNGETLTIQISGTGYSDFALTYAGRRTSGGFDSQSWAYSSDGINSTDFSSITFSEIGKYELKTVDFSSVDNLDNQSAIYFRATLTGATESNGNNRFDNISITAVPEAAEWGLISALGLFAVAGVHSWRNRRRSGTA